jgi:hypothetical protein
MYTTTAVSLNCIEVCCPLGRQRCCQLDRATKLSTVCLYYLVYLNGAEEIRILMGQNYFKLGQSNSSEKRTSLISRHFSGSIKNNLIFSRVSAGSFVSTPICICGARLCMILGKYLGLSRKSDGFGPYNFKSGGAGTTGKVESGQEVSHQEDIKIRI